MNEKPHFLVGFFVIYKNYEKTMKYLRYKFYRFFTFWIFIYEELNY